MLTYQSEHVHVFQSELYQTNAMVIEKEDLVLVVDPNYLPSEVDAIRRYVDEIRGSRELYLFFTHSDFDHIAGYGSFTDCKVIAGAAFANHPDKAERIEVVARLDDEFYIDRPYEIVFPTVDIAIGHEGQQLTVGSTVLTFQTAFGHNRDGLMCHVAPLNLLITGDYVSDIEFPFIFDTYANYRSTLSKIAAYSEESPALLLLPSHGSVTSEQSEVMSRIEASEDYLALTEMLLESVEDSRFEDFMSLHGYRYKRGFRLRHEENMKLLAKERQQPAQV